MITARPHVLVSSDVTRNTFTTNSGLKDSIMAQLVLSMLVLGFFCGKNATIIACFNNICS